MAINKKLIFWKSSTFNPPTTSTDVTKDVLWNSIVFFSDTAGGNAGKMWTHGLYYDCIPALTQQLTGFVVGSNVAISSSDTILSAFGKTQAQLNNKLSLSGGTLSGSLYFTGGVYNVDATGTGPTGYVYFRNATSTSTFRVYPETGNLHFSGSLIGGTVPWDRLGGVPSSFTPSAHTHDDRYYTETEIGNLFLGTTAITGYNKSNWDNVYTAFNAMQVGGRNLLIGSGVQVSNNEYLCKQYDVSPSSGGVLSNGYGYLVPGETYTVIVDWTPAQNVRYLYVYLSSGYSSLGTLQATGTGRQKSVRTFIAAYSVGRTPQDSPSNAKFQLYRNPNNGTVTDNTTIHNIYLVKGTIALTDWTPAPEDVDASIATVQTNLDTHVGATGAAHGVASTSVAGFMSSTDKSKLDGIATSANNYTHPTSGVTAGTYKSVTVNAAGHVTGGTNPTTLAGYGITDSLFVEEVGIAQTDDTWVKGYADSHRKALVYNFAGIEWGYIFNFRSDGAYGTVLATSYNGPTLKMLTRSSNTWASSWVTFIHSGNIGSQSVNYATTATKVNNSLAIKFDTGTTEGTNLYTFDGATGKTIDIKAGSNVSISKEAGIITISSTDTNTVYTHPTTSGNKHIPSGGASGQILRWNSDGTAEWGADNNTTYSLATTSTLGLVKLGSDTQQTVAAAAVTATASRSYAVQVNSSGQMVVNVPWVDTNTTYSAASDTVAGLVKVFSESYQSAAPASASTTANRTYLVQKLTDANGILVVNVPWVDTNTTYSNFVGGTSSVAGTAGLVPAPTTANYTYFLKGTGAWTQVNYSDLAGTVPTWNQSTTGSAGSVKSNATTGIMQITGPTAGTTRVMTTPNANFTAAALNLDQTFSGTKTFTLDTYFTGGLRVKQTAGAGIGISLYDVAASNPTYGLMFALTSGKGTHGSVTGDWATYFTMTTTPGRGWIFTTNPGGTTGNVASVSNTGIFVGADFKVGTNSVWHAGNLSPVTTNTDQTIGGVKTFSTGSSLTCDMANQTVGSVSICNTASSAMPCISGKTTAANAGLYFIAGTNNTNTAGDMVFNAREYDNTDFATLTSDAFIWKRYGTTIMSLTRSGNLTAVGNITGYSDIRLKKDIETVSGALDKVRQLRGVYFKRRDGADENRHVGVIAQEIEQVLPEVVCINSDGIRSVAYGNITALLIEAIKEQQKQIDELKTICYGS